MTQDKKIQYIQALRRMTILNPNYKTAKAILGLLTYYSNNKFDIDGIDNKHKADVLFAVLDKYTICEKYELEGLTGFPENPHFYAFTRFNIPKQICETIKCKYLDKVELDKEKKIITKRLIKRLKQEEINRINDNLNKTL